MRCFWPSRNVCTLRTGLWTDAGDRVRDDSELGRRRQGSLLSKRSHRSEIKTDSKGAHLAGGQVNRSRERPNPDPMTTADGVD